MFRLLACCVSGRIVWSLTILFVEEGCITTDLLLLLLLEGPGFSDLTIEIPGGSLRGRLLFPLPVEYGRPTSG